MSADSNNQQFDLGKLAEILEKLLKTLGSLAGVSSIVLGILYVMGFVITNTSLQRHGAYELSLLRAEFLAAGISFSVLTLVAILVGTMLIDPLANFLGSKADGRPLLVLAIRGSFRPISVLIILVAGVLLLILTKSIVRTFSEGVKWWEQFGSALSWAYVVALSGGIYVKCLEQVDFWKKLVSSSLPEIGQPILVGVCLLLVALVTYGAFAYQQLPRSWGGGNPIYVEFMIKEEARAMLTTLGLEIGQNGLTERVTFLNESPKRIYVITQRGDTLSFDPGLVEASKFYDVRFYVSADVHLSDGDWFREQGQWNRAIHEYDAALLISVDLFEARIGRGIVYVEKYIKSVQEGTPDQGAYSSAVEDLMEAIKQIGEPAEEASRAAEAHYHLSHLHFFAKNEEEAFKNFTEAIKLDSSFREMIMLEGAFREAYLGKASFRKILYDSDQVLADEYARLGNELREGDDIEKALTLYDVAISLAERFFPDDYGRRAQYHVYRGDALEALSRMTEAIAEYNEARSLDPSVLRYSYKYAKLSYKQGLLQDAKDACQMVIDQIRNDTVEDTAPVGCLIVVGNVHRDYEEWDIAIDSYSQAVRQSKALGATSFTADSYYEWARLEARRENAGGAIQYLENATWLNQAHAKDAESEVDFEPLHELVDFQRALSPPIIVGIEVNTEEETIIFRLQDSVDDFPERVTVLTRILGEGALITSEDTGQASSVEISEDKLVYTFFLREDASYSSVDLASDLRNILALVD